MLANIIGMRANTPLPSRQGLRAARIGSTAARGEVKPHMSCWGEAGPQSLATSWCTSPSSIHLSELGCEHKRKQARAHACYLLLQASDLRVLLLRSGDDLQQHLLLHLQLLPHLLQPLLLLRAGLRTHARVHILGHALTGALVLVRMRFSM